MDQKNIDNGKRAEKLFEQYLNDIISRITFFRIDQNKDTQAEELRDKCIRRPDYIIHTIKDIFYIDVKYRSKKPFGKNNEERFKIGQDNINSIYQFQKEFHQEVWLAFTDNLNEPEFYYTTISSIYEYYENIKKIYEEKNYPNFSKIYIYIPNSLLLFNKLSFENGFYKDDSKYFEEETENHKIVNDKYGK